LFVIQLLGCYTSIPLYYVILVPGYRLVVLQNGRKSSVVSCRVCGCRYYERRHKNNVAAKRSRESHKRNIETLERTALQLEQENRYYTAQNRLLRAQVEHYQELLARPPMSAARLKEELEKFR